MNIDSTIEDLEAQAYFASQVAKTNETFSLVIEVELAQPEQQAKLLNKGLVGLDFVAGFGEFQLQRGNKWILIPNHSINSITPLQGSLEESIVGLTALAFIDSKLRGALISVKQFNKVNTVQGKLVNMLGNHLVLKTNGLQLFPLESTEWLAVDSLSTDS